MLWEPWTVKCEAPKHQEWKARLCGVRASFFAIQSRKSVQSEEECPVYECEKRRPDSGCAGADQLAAAGRAVGAEGVRRSSRLVLMTSRLCSMKTKVLKASSTKAVEARGGAIVDVVEVGPVWFGRRGC